MARIAKSWLGFGQRNVANLGQCAPLKSVLLLAVRLGGQVVTLPTDSSTF